MKRLLLAATSVMLACGDGVTGPPEEVEYAPELGVDLATMQQTVNGVYYRDLVDGTGNVVAGGDIIFVSYTGWLVDGSEFDSNPGVCFPLGGVIPGWGEGIPGMREGGIRKLVIPPHMGYGDRGSGNLIPGNATLVFDVEVLSIGCPNP